jgi:unsaturated chondroitin disaccharide hydrolase
MKADAKIKPADLKQGVTRVIELACKKVLAIDKRWDASKGTPVFTVNGQYTTRGWTEWTQGFQYGCAILCYDGAGDKKLLELGKRQTVDRMASHVTHIGVHDHGFNNLSTYGNLRRLMLEGKTPHNVWELGFYEMAIKASGAVQAARWQGTHPAKDKAGLERTAGAPALGYIYSFNGPQSLFVDTMRSCRILGVAWQLGHKLMHENDKAADLLKRSVLHGLTTNQHIVFHGDSSPTTSAAEPRTRRSSIATTA